MEKGFKNITNLTPKAQADRIREIEHKLQHIAQTKTAQLREQKANACNARVAGLQKISNDLFKKLEAQLREQKETVKQLARQYQENKSEQDLLMKSRINQVVDLQNRFTAMWKQELQRGKEAERKIIVHYEERMQSMRIGVLKEVEKRKLYFQSLDLKLSQKLPQVQAQIALKMEASNENLTRIQVQAQQQTESLCRAIKEAQHKQIASFEQLMRMMASVIAEVKEEIGLEKESRQASKKKLLALFEGAYSKLVG